MSAKSIVILALLVLGMISILLVSFWLVKKGLIGKDKEEKHNFPDEKEDV